jgi:hypothetical protein
VTTTDLQLAEGLTLLQKGDMVTVRGQWRGLSEAQVNVHAGVMWAAAARFADSSGFQTTPTVTRLGAGPFLMSLGQDLATGDFTSSVRLRMSRQATAREVRQVINEYVMGGNAVSARSLILANQGDIIDPRTAPRSETAAYLTWAGIEQDPSGFFRDVWRGLRQNLEEVGGGLAGGLKPLLIPLVVVGAVVLLLQDEIKDVLKSLKDAK